mgnify:CR=1 FL=1
MPLHLAQHKSYHPYKRENIERVKRDEEIAYEAKLDEEERIAARNRHDRIVQLRRHRDAAVGRQTPIDIPSENAHINFWSEIEAKQPNLCHKPTESSIKLELQPWYTQADRKNGLDQQKSEQERERARIKDEKRKRSEDPLEMIREYTQKPLTTSICEAKDEPTISHAKERLFFREGTRAKRNARVRYPKRRV